LEASIKNVLEGGTPADSNTFEMLTYKPTATIPIGNQPNAAALLIFATSINDVTTLQTIMDRIFRRTLTSTNTGSITTVPPTQIVLITTIGTTRVDKMPFSFQNMMNGNKLTKRRQMEEYIVRYVHQYATQNVGGMDYTICHLGSEIQKDTTTNNVAFQLLPGDTLDGGNGIITIDTAVTVLTQAIALQPYARNATFSCAGKLPPPITTTTAIDTSSSSISFLLDDAFLKLDGPEVLRIENDPQLGTVEQLDVLIEYISEWADLLCTSGKGLTTPVRCEITTSSNGRALPSGVSQQASSIIRILFQPTNTGKYYVSKDDEREMASSNSGDGKSSGSSSPVRNINPRFTKEGGLEFVVEVVPHNNHQQLRIRVKRCNYSHDTIIKELSEQSILSQFKKCIAVWKNRGSE
jgi:hypothetical protein